MRSMHGSQLVSMNASYFTEHEIYAMLVSIIEILQSLRSPPRGITGRKDA